MRLFPEATLATFVAGVGLAVWLKAPSGAPIAVLLLGLAALTLAVGLRQLRLPAAPMLVAAALLLGFWRVEASPAPTLPIVPTGADVTVTLIVTDAPEAAGSRLRFRGRALDADDPLQSDVPAGTNLQVYTLPPPELVAQRSPPYLRYGDTLRLSGRLERPQPIGDFDYAAYLESQQISGVLWARQSQLVDTGGGSFAAAALHRARGALAQGIQQSVAAPQSGLAQALLLGIRAELPPALRESFRDAGMSHLLAISGLHVGVVMALSLGLARCVAGRGNPWVIVAAALIVWTYATLSGLDPPVVRSAIMGTLVLLQPLFGRGIRMPTTLLLAAAGMLAVDPWLLESLSFQLSFAAMTGVVLSLPIITAMSSLATAGWSASDAWAARWGQYGATLLVASLVISIMTSLATMPLVAWHFGAVPLMSVPATILAMPALPAALVTTAVTALAGLVSTTMAAGPGLLAWGSLSWLIELARAMPDILLPTDWLTVPMAIAWYVAMGVLIWLASLRSVRRLTSGMERRGRWRPTGVAAAAMALVPVSMLIALLLIGRLASAHADGRLHVYALDVGQGDAILIVTPEGRQMLVDGGPDGETTLTELGNLLPAGDRTLDVAMATHLDSDHVGGLLAVLQRYDANLVAHGIVGSDSALYPQWQSVLAARQLSAVSLRYGHRVALGSEVLLEVLYPPPGALPEGVARTPNNGSLVVRLAHGTVTFLFTGDIESDAERYLVATHRSLLMADVLKVGHHGSRTSTSPRFLQAVNPRSAVISAGAGNQFGHPHPDVMQRLESHVPAGQVFLTARDGTIEFVSDGQNLWVETANPPPR